jgi:hypothetical protein
MQGCKQTCLAVHARPVTVHPPQRGSRWASILLPLPLRAVTENVASKLDEQGTRIDVVCELAGPFLVCRPYSGFPVIVPDLNPIARLGSAPCK